MQERMYTVKEVAEQLRVSERTVRHWVEQGEIMVFKVGKRGYRISESNLAAFVQKRTGKQE